MDVTVQDWTSADAGLLASAYAREAAHWHERYAWGTAEAWAAVEQARCASRLPGAIAIDRRGVLRGWTFYLPDADGLTIGGLVAETPAVTGLLLDAARAAAERLGVTSVACFVAFRAPGLDAALRARGFTVEPFLYLVRELGPAGAEVPARRGPFDSWQAGDTAPAADLFEIAYPGASGRYFAPHGRPDQWLRYVTNLVEQTACGVLDPGLTRVVRRDRALDAVALVTRLAPDTVHLAQCAVRPTARRRGLAASLLDDVCTRAAHAGISQVTLLAGESNAPARALYEARRFVERGRFIAALRG